MNMSSTGVGGNQSANPLSTPRGTSPGTTHSVYVLSDLDGFKYKLVMQGDLRMLSVDKIKRYLQNATGLDASKQALFFNNRALQPNDSGATLGLQDGCTLRLQHVNALLNVAHNTNAAALNTSAGPSSSTSTFEIPHPRNATTLPPSHFQQRDSTASHSFSFASTVRGPGGNRSSAPSTHSSGGPPLAPTSQSTTQVALPPPSTSESALGWAAASARERFLEEENRRLSERLRESESDHRRRERQWQDEMVLLRHEIDRVESEKVEIERREFSQRKELDAMKSRQEQREEELVRDLDLLREERRKMKQEKLGEEEGQRALVYNLESQIHSLRRDVEEQAAVSERLRRELDDKSRIPTALAAPPSPALAGRSRQVSVTETLQRNLQNLARELSVDPAKLRLDDNYTCVVPLSETLSILLTFDPATHRLFLYSTLLNQLPQSPAAKLQLYEVLLEGALLGRDMAGGGVGISKKNDIAIMSTSLDLQHADEHALAVVSAPFIEATQKWIKTANDISSAARHASERQRDAAIMHESETSRAIQNGSHAFDGAQRLSPRKMPRMDYTGSSGDYYATSIAAHE